MPAATLATRPGPSDHLEGSHHAHVLVLEVVEIAEALFITPDTARTYVSRILTKLQARDRSQLVILAYEVGLIRPGSTPADRRGAVNRP